jgi:hypothetical protein
MNQDKRNNFETLAEAWEAVMHGFLESVVNVAEADHADTLRFARIVFHSGAAAAICCLRNGSALTALEEEASRGSTLHGGIA